MHRSAWCQLDNLCCRATWHWGTIPPLLPHLSSSSRLTLQAPVPGQQQSVNQSCKVKVSTVLILSRSSHYCMACCCI